MTDQLLTIHQQRQYRQEEDFIMSLTNDTIEDTTALESVKVIEMKSMTMRVPMTGWDDGNDEANKKTDDKNEKIYMLPKLPSFSVAGDDIESKVGRTTIPNDERGSVNPMSSASQTVQAFVHAAIQAATDPPVVSSSNVTASKTEEQTPNIGTTQPLFKCACTWKNCRAYQKAFRQIHHEVFDGVIKIKITEGHPESMAYQQCLHRTLGITQKPEWKDSTANVSQQQHQHDSDTAPPSTRRFCRYTIAKHHFTEQHIRKYEMKNKVFSFIKPFSYHGAKKYLYKVDPRETYIPPNTLTTIVDPESALYLQCPNVPSDVVKGTYHKIAQIIRQRQKLQHTGLIDPTVSKQPIEANAVETEHKQQVRNECEYLSHSDENDINQQPERMQQAQHRMENQQESTIQSRFQYSQTSISNPSGATTQSTNSTTNAARATGDHQQNKYAEDSTNDDAQINYKAMLIEKEAENKELKTKLEDLKSHLEYLQSMVETLQLQQLRDSSSRHSRGSRQTFVSSTSSRNRRRKNQQTTRSNDSLRSGGRSEEEDEHDYYDDQLDQTTILSRNLDEVSELQTLATGASFQSKFTQRIVDDKLYNDPESETDDDDDDYSYADCMSLGTSTIISASRSVKSLPRERELDENDGDQTTDDDMTFPKQRSYRTNSIRSVESNSVQSLNTTFTTKYSRSSNRSLPQQRPPTHRSIRTSKGTSTTQGHKRQVKRFWQSSVGSLESKFTSSAGSIGNTFDNSVEGGPFASSPKSATITTASSSAFSSTDQQSVITEIVEVATNTSVSVSEMYAEHDIHSDILLSPPVKTSLIDEVTNIRLTDPYGEQGNYSGQICRDTGMPNGYGRLEYDKAGRWYEGDWQFGRWTGKGKLSNHNGDYYEGDVADDMKHGFGYMRFADGRTYEGEYINGEMVDGKMTYEDGSTYEGQWKNGLRHGHGRCIFLDESSYDGEFKDGEFWGRGKMVWNDGGWYEGDWKNGEMHGIGTEVRPDGRLRHHGQWFRGQPIRRQN